MKKHLKRNKKFFKRYLFFASISTYLIILFVHNFNFQKINFSLILRTFLLCFIIFFSIGIILSFPLVKGVIGEHKVAKKIRKLKNIYGGFIINDVIIPDLNKNATSQIDHIYFSNYGIYVFESKNYAGMISGDDTSKEWTQYLANGKVINKLYNPVLQNNTHIERLKKILNIDKYFYSIIIFSKGNIKNINSSYVYSLADIKNLLNKKRKVFKNEEIEKYYNIIKKYKDYPIKSKKEHIKEVNKIKKEFNDVDYCPLCKGKLLLRKTSSGYEFLGCSNYPKCKFTKKIYKKS